MSANKYPSIFCVSWRLLFIYPSCARGIIVNSLIIYSSWENQRCKVSKKEIESSADGKGKNLTSPSTMTDIIVQQLQQLQQVLERLTCVEGKLGGVLEKVQRLETALSGVQSDITDLQCKTTQLKKATGDMDAGLNNLNMEVQEMRKKLMRTRRKLS